MSDDLRSELEHYDALEAVAAAVRPIVARDGHHGHLYCGIDGCRCEWRDLRAALSRLDGAT